MKLRTLFFVALAAIATLSFTFVSVNKSETKPVVDNSISSSNNEPAGGFVSEDKF